METKEAALAALRTWRTYMDDRDRLVGAARSAGATIAEITEASGLAKNTVRAAIEAADPGAQTQENSMGTTTADPLAGFHHPHFVSGQPGRWSGEVRFEFRPFTGQERAPEMPSYEILREAEVSLEDENRLRAEYQAAKALWGQARFKLRARPALEQATPVWDAYTRAQQAMDAAFAAVADADDNQWRRMLLKLVDAHRATLAAAQQWDDVAKGLAELELEHWREMGYEHEMRLSDAASAFGLDIRDWYMDSPDRYEPSSWSSLSSEPFMTPLVAKVSKGVQEQKDRLQAVSDLAGDR